MLSFVIHDNVPAAVVMILKQRVKANGSVLLEQKTWQRQGSKCTCGSSFAEISLSFHDYLTWRMNSWLGLVFVVHFETYNLNSPIFKTRIELVLYSGTS